jgi:type I restriction enzyme S subunit
MMGLIPSGISGEFLYQLLLTIDLGRYRQEGAVPSINGARVGEIAIDLPPFPEQKRIADILGTWDEALEKLDALITTKERRKDALVQQLLTGQRRLSGYRTKWANVHLKEVARESAQRNGTKLDRSRLYAVTKAEGMVPMREQVQGATIDRCKIVEYGWFAYNPMRINIGSIARWEKRSPVMVSPDYVVFHTDESRLLSDYLNHLRRSAHWSSFVGGAGNGSVRVRIWFDDLGHLRFQLPPVSEQRAMTDILDTADKELRLLRDQRQAVETQKRGLMQKLLTGKVRVSIP